MEEIKPEQSGLIYHDKGISVFVKKRDTLTFFFCNKIKRTGSPEQTQGGNLGSTPIEVRVQTKLPDSLSLSRAGSLQPLHWQTTVKICTDFQLPRKAPPTLGPSLGFNPSYHLISQ